MLQPEQTYAQGIQVSEITTGSQTSDSDCGVDPSIL